MHDWINEISFPNSPTTQMPHTLVWLILKVNTQPEDGPQVVPKHVVVIFFMY